MNTTNMERRYYVLRRGGLTTLSWLLSSHTSIDYKHEGSWRLQGTTIVGIRLVFVYHRFFINEGSSDKRLPRKQEKNKYPYHYDRTMHIPCQYHDTSFFMELTRHAMFSIITSRRGFNLHLFWPLPCLLAGRCVDATISSTLVIN